MDDWDTTGRETARALRDLPDDGWLTLAAPHRPAADGGAADQPRKGGGLLGRLTGRSRPEPAAELFVQFRRQGTYLYAECVGGPSVGGPFPWTEAEHEALLAAGWRLPPQFGAPVYVRFFPADDGPAPTDYLTGDLVGQAAALAVRTLRDIGATSAPGSVALTRG